MEDKINKILRETFFETIETCKKVSRLKESIAKSRHMTKIYPAEHYPEVGQPKYDHTDVEVNSFRTFEAAARWKDTHVAVLNFACATNPGGGVIMGSTAQEESLCRCSTLYPVLNTPDNSYGFYRVWELKDRYTDRAIYSPGITVFMKDKLVPQPMEEKDWFEVDVLTCAAPNLRYTDIEPMELYGIHVKRAIHLMTIAAANNVEVLILGAFGCGAFKNDPQVVARAYRDVLPWFKGYFKRIEFAVYSKQLKKSDNVKVFQEVIGHVKKSHSKKSV